MITIEINDTEVTAVLERAVDALTDMTPLMQDLGDMLLESTKVRFGKGVAPDGTPWAPNSPVTLARKRDSRPLWGPNDRLHRDFGLVATATSAEISTSCRMPPCSNSGAPRLHFRIFGATSRPVRSSVCPRTIARMSSTRSRFISREPLADDF